MKFILKVLVLVCLVIVSRLAKEDAVSLQKPGIKSADSNAVLTNHTLTPRVPISQTSRSVVSLKFEKGALQIN